MQLVQGLGKADSPTVVCFPPIVQPWTMFSRQALRSICGIEWQGTRGFLKIYDKILTMSFELTMIYFESLQEIAGQVKSGTLHISRNVQVVAGDFSQGRFSQFCQLGFSETHCRVFILIPVNLFYSRFDWKNKVALELTRNDRIFLTVWTELRWYKRKLGQLNLPEVVFPTYHLLRIFHAVYNSRQIFTIQNLTWEQINIINRWINSLQTVDDFWWNFTR